MVRSIKSAEKAGWEHQALPRCPGCGNKPTIYHAAWSGSGNLPPPVWRVTCTRCGRFVKADEEDEVRQAWKAACVVSPGIVPKYRKPRGGILPKRWREHCRSTSGWRRLDITPTEEHVQAYLERLDAGHE